MHKVLAVVFLIFCGCATPVVYKMYLDDIEVKVHTYNTSKCPPEASGCTIIQSEKKADVYLPRDLRDYDLVCHEFAHVDGMRHGKWEHSFIGDMMCTTVTVAPKSEVSKCGRTYPVGKFICNNY